MLMFLSPEPFIIRVSLPVDPYSKIASEVAIHKIVGENTSILESRKLLHVTSLPIMNLVLSES